MLKYTMVNHRVTIDPMSLTLEPLRLLWVADKSKIKEDAVMHLTYIHIVSQIDPDAPFSKSDPNDISALARKEIFGDFGYTFSGKFNEKFMEETVVSYQLAFETAEECAVRTFNKKIYQIQKKIDETDIIIKESTIRGATTFVSNFTIINKMMQDLTKITKARDELEASIVRGSSRGDVKGQRKLSFLEKRRRDMNKVREDVGDDESEEENF